MYLWERKFGTSAYEGSGLARLLDRWVARLIGYVDAAANYRMLLEIPKRLREHAAALSAELEQRRAALQTLEEEARAAHPAGRLEAGLEEIERKVADLDEKIAHESARRNALEKQRAQLAGGNDSEYRKAIELLAFELSRQDMRSLKREAELTATGHDDELVRAIDDIREEIAELEEDVERDRDAVSSLDRRRSELEAVRGRYVSRRYDDATSYFDNDSLLKDLLAGVLGGVLSGGGMWRQIEREHRRRSRSDMDFGWRGFPTPGTGRSLPRGRSGGSIFGGGSIFTGGGRSTRPSRPPRRSGGGGGFRTGGGF